MEISKGRDMREKGWFWLDDEYLNGYARYLGVTATCVYLSLCRHADKEQTCFPKLDTISKEIGVSRKTTIRAVKRLEHWNIISVVKEYDSVKKRQKVNVYLLLDKKHWANKPKEQGVISTHSPGCNKVQKQGVNFSQSRVSLVHSKETHIKGTQYKDSKVETLHAQIVQIIDFFKEVNPSYQKWFGNKTQRKSIENLLKAHPFEQIQKVIAILPKTNKVAYIPTITTPLQLEDKWAQLESSLIKMKNQPNNQPNYIL